MDLTAYSHKSPFRWGGSLTVQTAVMMLACLVCAQWVTVWAFCDERAAMLREAAAREVALIAAHSHGDPAAWSRDGLAIWSSDTRPDRLPPQIAAMLEPRAAPMAAWAQAAGGLDWPQQGGVAIASVGYRGAVLSAVRPDGNWVVAALPMPRWTDPWATQSWSALGLTSLGLMLAALMISRKVTGPMRAMAAAADGFRGADPALVEAAGPTEMRRTLAAFNAMQQRISALMGERARMLSALGHDLRTPMTRLRLRAHLLEDEDLREPVLRDLGEIEALSERALDLARGTAGERAVRQPLDALLEELCGDLKDAGLRVGIDRLDPVTAPVRAHALRRAVTNLVENADRYAGGALLSLEGSDAVRIVVRDDGPGIPPARLQEVMEPFVRLDAARGRHRGGSGLGLALAAATAREHDGTLILRNRSSGGLEAVIDLPG